MFKIFLKLINKLFFSDSIDNITEEDGMTIRNDLLARAFLLKNEE